MALTHNSAGLILPLVMLYLLSINLGIVALARSGVIELKMSYLESRRQQSRQVAEAAFAQIADILQDLPADDLSAGLLCFGGTSCAQFSLPALNGFAADANYSITVGPRLSPLPREADEVDSAAVYAHRIYDVHVQLPSPLGAGQDRYTERWIRRESLLD